MRILTNEQMQAVDAETIDRVCPGLELMERAGRGCAEYIMHEYEDASDPRVVMFVGGGNNGGDGLVIARYLAEHDWDVYVHLLTAPGALKGDAGRNYHRLKQLVGTSDNIWMRDAADPDWIVSVSEDVRDCEVVVDAIFGTGITGAPRGRMLEAIRIINEFSGHVVSIDIPSGVDGTTGATPGEAVVAGATLTIGAPKLGLLFHPGRYHCAGVSVIDIGFPDEIIDRHADSIHLLDEPEAAARLPYRGPDVHKFDAGVVTIVAGSRQYRGAALLCAEAALRGGAGMVYLGVPASIHAEIDVALREVIVIALPETDAGTVHPDAVRVLAPWIARSHAVGIGPGLGREPGTDAFVESMLVGLECPVVLDADAINAFAGRADVLASACSGRPVVITPHSGELSRLLGEEMPESPIDRIEMTRRISALLGATLVHKGSTLLVGHPDGSVFVNTAGSSALATAGTGDVLTGFVASFLSQGADMLDAALVGSYLHGKAGDEAAEELGKRGVIASDLLWSFGPVMARLEALAGD